jgi:hypothetical protein
MARRRREAYRGLWVLCVCAAGLHGTLGQTCGSEYISWPREQCTQVTTIERSTGPLRGCSTPPAGRAGLRRRHGAAINCTDV